MGHRRGSSFLEMEAANYFKLDPNLMHMFNSGASSRSIRRISPTNRLATDHLLAPQADQRRSTRVQAGRQKVQENTRNKSRCQPSSSQQKVARTSSSLTGGAARLKHNIPDDEQSVVLSTCTYLVESSTASTNSLPSLASSPSLSPSMTCPHLSLDDILAVQSQQGSRSPHTIGLCPKCQLNPPPYIQSPLSPAFKCHQPRQAAVCRPKKTTSSDCIRRAQSTSNLTNANTCRVESTKLRRGYSDHKGRKVSETRRKQLQAKQDDSLDYCLEPKEMQRMQLSPSLRHSVEYIRQHSIEAGRILTIYKNGQPFERPLRVCIGRGEFSTLNHLLDHINGRQVIPLGARYLFHLDGQLVYSVNELKHGSIYIVSGTRIFDYKSNVVIREHQKKAQLRQRLYQDLEDAADQPELQSPKREIPAKSTTSKTSNEQLQMSPVKPARNDPAKSNKVKLKKSVNDIPANEAVRKTARKPRSQLHLSPKSRAIQTEPKVVSVQTSSNSNENLSLRYDANGDSQDSASRLTRAKSELSALPRKRKKNVTFMDTGRGSSPAIDSVPVSQSNTKKEDHYVQTSPTKEQVESQLQQTKETTDTNEIGIQVSDSIEGFLIDLPLPMPEKEPERRPGKRQFLRKGQGTRLGRYNQIGNASGKRANNASQKCAVGSPKRQVVTISERQLSIDEMSQFKDLDHGDHHSETHKVQHAESRLDANDSTAQEPSKVEFEVQPDRTNTIVIGQQPEEDAKQKGKSQSGGWQYPAGRESSATPTERSVSQSEASAEVRAQVSTPTPSVSTGGENSSLSNSNEPKKQVAPVRGKLTRGLLEPSKNFRLVWVNGFCINENLAESSSSSSQSGANNSDHPHQTETVEQQNLLSPSHSSKKNVIVQQFRPTERYNNWMCHSNMFEELIYPAGSLIILWSRWNNEQRYYSKHTSSVSAISLLSSRADLVASAQIGDQLQKPAIHLWSISGLQTLALVESDQLSGCTLFSLKVAQSTVNEFHLSAGARDDKRLWLFKILVKSSTKTTDEQLKKQPQTSQTITVIKVSKLLQNHQVPLQVTSTPCTKSASSKDSTEEALISFGRRHFQVYQEDRRQMKLRQMLPEEKSPQMINSITNANCLVRMSPNEFIVGDMNGQLTLMTLNCQVLPSKTFNASAEYSNSKYKVETRALLLTESGEAGNLNSNLSKSPAITCLARISGNIIAVADSDSNIKLFRICRSKSHASQQVSDPITCKLINSIHLSLDSGYICCIILANYYRQKSMVEFYAATTNNSIVFASSQLGGATDSSGVQEAVASFTLSPVQEGHESPAMSLVADFAPINKSSSRRSADVASKAAEYFTCSLDCKICKWSNQNLVWKSTLPSACVSLAVHPTGFVLAIGSADGTVYILDKISGLLISYFPLTPVCINCLAYSSDGLLLAAGCANGCMFILPVYDRGLKYKKVSIFQSPLPVVSLQFSMDNQYILTSVTHGFYQELILWDPANFRYLRDNVKSTVDRLQWFDASCSGSEDVRAIWENANLDQEQQPKPRLSPTRRPSILAQMSSSSSVINLSCHRLMRSSSNEESFAIASDTRGYIRLFHYPCRDIDQGFYSIRISSSAINCCRFLVEASGKFVSTSLDGSICIWELE